MKNINKTTLQRLYQRDGIEDIMAVSIQPAVIFKKNNQKKI